MNGFGGRLMAISVNNTSNSESNSEIKIKFSIKNTSERIHLRLTHMRELRKYMMASEYAVNAMRIICFRTELCNHR